LSLGLALTAIGGPLWLLFWRAGAAPGQGNQEENRRGDAEIFFLNFILLVSAFIW